MESEHLQNARRILEVAPGANREEITQAYNLLKRIHGAEPGLAVAMSMEEFDPEARRQVMEEIEAAYADLCAIPTQELTEPLPEDEDDLLPERPSALRLARNEAGLTLERLAQDTCIRKDYLKAIEDERFADLPLATVHVRGYVSAFASAVGLAGDSLVPAYLKRFQDWQGAHR